VLVGVDDLASCTRLKPASLWLDGILDSYERWKGLSYSGKIDPNYGLNYRTLASLVERALSCLTPQACDGDRGTNTQTPAATKRGRQ
jgi:hypothetical protein